MWCEAKRFGHRLAGRSKFLAKQCSLDYTVLLLQAVFHMKSYLEGAIVHGQIALSCNQTLWVDPAECKVELKSK